MPEPNENVVLVTGAATGIGNLTARALAAAGHTVYASMRDVVGRDAGHAGELVELGRREGQDLRVVQLDVHDARGEGWTVNHKRIQRLWREEGLRVVVKRRRKRVGSSTVPPVPPVPSATGPNMVWAIDFQFDSTTDGRPVKILSVVDEHTRECLGGLVERSITGEVLATELNRITATRGGGGPAVLRLDNGPEMIAAALAEWAGTKTGMLFIPPGEPWRNPFIETFNGRLRDECLNIHLFWSLTHAKVTIGDWKEEYNHDRPHSSLGYRSPGAYAAICTH
jgi:putative transposase